MTKPRNSTRKLPSRPALPRRCGGSAHAFTLIEMMVASVLTVLLLTGVYATLRQVTVVGAQTATRSQAGAQTERLAAEVADALEQAVRLEDPPFTLTVGEGETASTLIFTGYASVGGRPVLQRQRWRWQNASDSAAAELTRARVQMAGGVVIEPGVDPEAEDPFAAVSQQTLGRGFDRLSVEWRGRFDTGGAWRSSTEDQTPWPVVFRVRVETAEASAERIVEPRSTARLLGGPDT